MHLWPFSRSRITTYERTASGVSRVDFSQLPRGSAEPHKPVVVEGEQLKTRLQELREQPLTSEFARPVGRHNRVNPDSMLMGFDSKDPVSLDYIELMAQVGQVEGFQVIASARPEELRRAERKLDKSVRDQVRWVGNPGGHDSWVEDHGEFTQAGEVVIPAILPADSDDIEDWVIRGRRNRYQALAEKGQPRPRADFALQGLVNRRQAQEQMISTAIALGAPTKLAGSYVEGGNMLAGQRPDGNVFALVGKDSLEVTRRLLPKGADEAAAVRQVAQDYALAENQVIGIEQPGDFHLDMAMSLAGPGQVILNDARKVLELQQGWVTEHYAHKWLGKDEMPAELEALKKRTERQAVFEDLVAEELKAAGLEVFRVAGVFPKTSASPEMNFLNLRQGVNEQGQAFAVALGGQERAERAFAEDLLSQIPSGYHRIHFLDRRLTEESLKYKGGIKCRSKVLV